MLFAATECECDVFGKSHSANVPPENFQALAEAAAEVSGVVLPKEEVN
jgi:hypothetical protein